MGRVTIIMSIKVLITPKPKTTALGSMHFGLGGGGQVQKVVIGLKRRCKPSILNKIILVDITY
jgi:hypothetical protein